VEIGYVVVNNSRVSQRRKGRSHLCDRAVARSAKAEKQSRNTSSLLNCPTFRWVLRSFTLFCLSLFSPLFAHNLILTCPHKIIPLQVEFAESPYEQEKGLMFRTYLSEDEGMLFLFPKPKSMSMWMKNTPLSLDMIFCNENGKILAIHENMTPYSLKIIGPVEGTAQVLEVVGGTVQKHGVSQACILTLDR
jgi:uncharacterized protein